MWTYFRIFEGEEKEKEKLICDCDEKSHSKWNYWFSSKFIIISKQDSILDVSSEFKMNLWQAFARNSIFNEQTSRTNTSSMSVIVSQQIQSKSIELFSEILVESFRFIIHSTQQNRGKWASSESFDWSKKFLFFFFSQQYIDMYRPI